MGKMESRTWLSAQSSPANPASMRVPSVVVVFTSCSLHLLLLLPLPLPPTPFLFFLNLPCFWFSTRLAFLHSILLCWSRMLLHCSFSSSRNLSTHERVLACTHTNTHTHTHAHIPFREGSEVKHVVAPALSASTQSHRHPLPPRAKPSSVGPVQFAAFSAGRCAKNKPRIPFTAFPSQGSTSPGRSHP